MRGSESQRLPSGRWNGRPTGARKISPHRGGGSAGEAEVSPRRDGSAEEILNAHPSVRLTTSPVLNSTGSVAARGIGNVKSVFIGGARREPSRSRKRCRG